MRRAVPTTVQAQLATIVRPAPHTMVTHPSELVAQATSA